MNSSLEQIVISPEERTDELLERVMQLADESPIYISARTRAYLYVRLLLHPVGLHTFVRMKVYDKTSDRLIDTGWKVCMYCSRAKLR